MAPSVGVYTNSGVFVSQASRLRLGNENESFLTFILHCARLALTLHTIIEPLFVLIQENALYDRQYYRPYWRTPLWQC